MEYILCQKVCARACIISVCGRARAPATDRSEVVVVSMLLMGALDGIGMHNALHPG